MASRQVPTFLFFFRQKLPYHLANFFLLLKFPFRYRRQSPILLLECFKGWKICVLSIRSISEQPITELTWTYIGQFTTNNSSGSAPSLPIGSSRNASSCLAPQLFGMGPGHCLPYNGFLMYRMVTATMSTPGGCGGDGSKLQLNDTMCISHLSHNNFKTLAIITLTFLSLV